MPILGHINGDGPTHSWIVMMAKNSLVKNSAAQQLRVNEAKWSKQLWRAGWTALPNVIFERQQALGLDPMDINIILHIASYWWKPEGKPHPSKVTIADAIGVHPRTVQRRIAALESAGFIEREERRTPGIGSKTNIYHLDGLIKAAKPYAIEKLEEREERAELRRARARRKGKPILKVIRGEDD
ncbi:MAG: helix-turn-helix domain-containing protein [Sphingomonadales bacterium]|nr:helix-turn-helix domain-containing protein [Sphingomonadales bacterium]